MASAPPVDLSALQTFVVFCEVGSMTLAAQRLGVSQSAVSQLVKRLELNLACSLVDRDARPAQLTNAGRTLLELSRDLLAHANTVAERVRQGGLAGHPRIRLGCVDSFAATVGPALIRALSNDASELHLGSGLTPGLLAQLLGRELDLVICTDAAINQSRLTQTPLFAERFVLVLPLAFEGLPAPTLQEVNVRLPLIRYSLRSLMGQQVERYLRHLGLQAGRRFEFDATDPLLSLVAAGLGWAISTPLCLWQSRHFMSQVAVFPLPGNALGQREFFLLEHRGEWQQLGDEMARVTRQVMRQTIAPEIHAALPLLDEAGFDFFESPVSFPPDPSP
jgi:DNA-binding transcriptional LysR family regulator